MRVEGLEKWEDRIKACELGNGNTIYYVERNGVDFEVGIYLGDKKTLEVYNQVDYSLMDILNSVRHSNLLRLLHRCTALCLLQIPTRHPQCP